VYTKRATSGAGMWLQNAFDIAVKYGAPEDTELKGDNLTEDQANAYVPTQEETTQALKYRGKNYVFINKDDIDEIARVIDQGHTPVFLTRCDISEWTPEPTVNLKFTYPFNINHAIPAIYAGMRNGVKTIVISDSWGSSYGKNGLRYLSEDFIKTRVEAVGYIVDLPDELVPPVFKFNKDLHIGMRNVDVLQLQKRLLKEGVATFIPTGYFGYLTLKAVANYQKAHNLTPTVGFCGPLTRAELNK
jgi:peptidoglycan hydrolase-like protein with peptidoglycan-binding domain